MSTISGGQEDKHVKGATTKAELSVAVTLTANLRF